MDSERRKLERFGFSLPAQISVGTNGDSKNFESQTRDISSGGAFFKTEGILVVGTEVKIDLVLSLEKLRKIQGKQARIKISGKVVRTEEEGVAVCFNENYQILPLVQGASFIY